VRGQIGPAVYTVTTTSMAPRLQIWHRRRDRRQLKFVGPKMTETNAVVAGVRRFDFGRIPSGTGWRQASST
jgi:hypothetical protein